MLDKKQIEKAFEEYMECLIENEELFLRDGYIYYSQEWWNDCLMKDWALEGYNTQELIYINQLFEDYKYEKEEEIEECVYQKYCPINDEIYEEYEVVGHKYVTYLMKKIA